MHNNAFAAGASLRTPLRELTALPLAGLINGHEAGGFSQTPFWKNLPTGLDTMQ